MTSANPQSVSSSHYYTASGEAMHFVPKKDGGGNRPTTVADARKLNLLPSPTTILKLLNKPALIDWIVEQACLAVLTSPKQPEENLDAFVHRVLHVQKEQDAERDAAAEAGTEIHSAIECALNEREYPASLSGYVLPVLDVLNPLGRVVATEKVLVSPYGHAGRVDAILEDTAAISVIDLKGCKNLPKYGGYPEHQMQVASYAASIGNTEGKLIRCFIVYIHRVDKHIKVCEVEDWPTEYRKFRLLLEYWRLANNCHIESATKPQQQLIPF